MNTQNKNAYEIRLEVLSIAHNDLMEIYHQKLHNAKMKMIGEDGWTEEKIDENIITNLLPTPADVIKRAKELYTFVEGV
jgi:epoxyqueuosine reductase QueG